MYPELVLGGLGVEFVDTAGFLVSSSTLGALDNVLNYRCKRYFLKYLKILDERET